MRHTPICSQFSLGFTFELDPVSGVDDAIQDGVCQSRVGDAKMPVGHRYLAGDQGGSVSETII